MLTDQQLLERAINKMFQIAGHNVKFEDIVKRQDEWYTDYTMTREQNEEWVDWLARLIRKERRHLNKKYAQYNANMINLTYGLKVII